MTLTYEQQLNSDLRWALMEGSMHFEGKSAVYSTLEKITRRLKELIRILGIPLDYSEQLDPFVREKFEEIWRSVHLDV
jgi:hypothetical protein